MKILTPRNNKDYYDYLTGIYGIDEKVVFDRRQFTILSRLDHPIFSYQKSDKDTPKIEVPIWMRKDKRIPEYKGKIFECLLEVGLKWFFFEVERYLENDTVCLDWILVKTIEISKRQRVGSSPISFFSSYDSYGYYGWNIGLTKDERYHKIEVKDDDTISNPILTGTTIPSMIPAEEIYNLLCAYISSLNEVEIVDTRTDIQKAESAGFDRKTSFRNIK
ncbi:MAG: hypothetical protein K2K27_03830 [Muribaculaceae bacterium]|nr:hypothetical protein [Muribaculaceae bacterium]